MSDMELARIIDHPRTTKPITGRTLNSSLRRLAPWRPDGAIVQITDERGPAKAWYNVKTGDATISYEALDDIGDLRLSHFIDDISKTYSDRSWSTLRENSLYDVAMALVGMVVHETSHAAWSSWLSEAAMAKRITARQHEAMSTFEELRIERRAIDYDPSKPSRRFLRASFQTILDDLETTELTSRWAVAGMWALTVGRAHATVCELDEVRGVDDVVRTILSDEDVEELHDIVGEAIELEMPQEMVRMIALANRWADLVGDKSPTGFGIIGGEATAGGEIISVPDGEGGDESDTPGGGSESGTPGGGGHGMSDASSEEEYARVTEEDAAALAKAVEDWVEEVRNTDPSDVKTGDPRKFAVKVFGKKKIAQGASWNRRPPSAKDRQAATALARHLEQITYTAPSVTRVAAAVPPGRLDTREAVQGIAQRRRGSIVTAKPWETKRRRHVHTPALTIALMTDTSGSMRWAQEAVASCAYVFANATHRIGGRFAAVTFGNDAEAVVRPGELPRDVRARTANGGYEAFDDAMAAIDGVLHLTDSKPGAKVVVVFSDNHLVRPHEPEKRDLWLAKLRAAGVAVVWIDDMEAPWLPDWVQCVKVHPGDALMLESAKVIAQAVERSLVAGRRG